MKVQTSNLCRECIREFFPTRKCFVFDRPTNDKELLADIENVSEYQLNPKFQEQTKKFCSYIFTNAKTKTLREGVLVTGNCKSFFPIIMSSNILQIFYIMCFSVFLLDFIWNSGLMDIHTPWKKCVYFIIVLFGGL